MTIDEATMDDVNDTVALVSSDGAIGGDSEVAAELFAEHTKLQIQRQRRQLLQRA